MTIVLAASDVVPDTAYLFEICSNQHLPFTPILMLPATQHATSAAVRWHWMPTSRFAQTWAAVPLLPLAELGEAVRGWSLRMFADHVSWQTTLTLMFGRGGSHSCITGRTLRRATRVNEPA